MFNVRTVIVPPIPDCHEIKDSDSKGMRYLLNLINNGIFESDEGVYKTDDTVVAEGILLSDWIDFKKGGYVDIIIDETNNIMKVFYVPKDFVGERNDLLYNNEVSVQEGTNNFVDLSDELQFDEQTKDWKTTDPRHFAECLSRFNEVRKNSYWTMFDVVFE